MPDTVATTRIPVLTAESARELDARTIATLDDSFTLMRRAALGAATWIARNTDPVARTAAVFIGTGNNGGDGWLIASLLKADGWTVRVRSIGDSRSPDARRARDEALRHGPMATPRGDEAVAIDALLGTGASGPPRDPVIEAMGELQLAADRGATVIAIDLPSALDATNAGDFGAIPATHTLTFGSVKRAHLLRRDLVGSVHVIDIGLVDAATHEPLLVTSALVRSWLAPLAPDAYKSTRGRLAIVGGENGMAGAVILAASGAHASGVGMVRADVAPMSALAVQIATPFATAHSWHNEDWSRIDCDWPNALVIGPGLDGGTSNDATAAVQLRAKITALLARFVGPVVLDAGALTAFASYTDQLRDALAGRPALLTPHVGEFERLFRRAPDQHALARFDDPSALALSLNATVLLKGVPTVIASPENRRYISAAGTPALAVGGSGDILAGIAGALLAQGVSPFHAGAAAAWVHGTAAERATLAHGGWRGITIETLLREVSNVWPTLSFANGTELHQLPAISTR
jgi:ADP-dependent NAD(P)H-hydrate dehydratase / NAD(P)H-hydrate epimerase